MHQAESGAKARELSGSIATGRADQPSTNDRPSYHHSSDVCPGGYLVALSCGISDIQMPQTTGLGPRACGVTR